MVSLAYPASKLTPLSLLLALLVVAMAVVSRPCAAAAFIVKNGKANAEIVIAPKPLRMVRVAADELRVFVRKMSGAKLPIVSEPSGAQRVRIYIGESDHTDRLGVRAEGLKHGAFRMVSGTNWLALVGGDYDFEPREPWPRSHKDTARAQEEWDQATGRTWLNPMAHLYKDYNREFGIWRQDQGGSLNAVYDYLRSLGCRWYLPGELGEVVPKRESIPLPSVNKTVRPSFALRCLKWTSYAAVDWDDLIWDRRMAVNVGYQVWGAKTYKSHGLRAVIGRKEMQKAHPDYYALLGGRRDTEKNGTGTPCLRSEGLIGETVAYCRAVFDHYDEPMVDIWPTDGFKQCQCDRCKGVESVSDYVWGFVDRVAREVHKTHPDRRITCGAYASYVEPPPSIAKLSPNVVVYIANRGRPGFGDPERWQAYWRIIEGWRSKVAPGNMLRGENNLYTFSMGGRTGPIAFAPLHPREFARDLKALKGICMGERNETSRGVRRAGKEHTWRAPGVDHLNLYVSARFLWDADQDVRAVLTEYYALFYGPARKEMQAAIEFADSRFPRGPGRKRDGGWLPPLSVRARLVEMLHAARKTAGDTVYGRRVQMILDELPPLDHLRSAKDLADRRGNVITYDRLMDLDIDRNREERETFHLDGKLDEPFWQWYPHGRNLQKAAGGKPLFRTTFMARWYSNSIYFGIRCEEKAEEAVDVSTKRDDAPAILEGDRIEILLETSPESCYRLAIDPAGALLDADLTPNGRGTRWSSNADVGAHVGKGFWSVEACIPVVSQADAAMDPGNYVAGQTPTSAWPWYFNIGRVRVRGNEKQVMAYSAVKGSRLTDRTKFARLMLRGDAKRLLRSRGKRRARESRMAEGRSE